MILAKLGIQPDSGSELLRGAEIDSIRLYTALRPTATATVPVPEHINLLSRVPGWQACRRFELVDIQSVSANLDSPKPPRFLALHRWRDLNGSSTPQFKAATNTPWRTRVMEGVVARERSVWRLVERPY
ncbi:hypothetical protein BT96DRAFT_917583 [Gymnopus androsaceus JB14]|uniref:Uncharacterized protein n=1 Tax=Gymnopus androsaceus JB14 TaxID=1447944 RepID=A0A6A4I2B2_9AGAR|nr:hypothetical protein BT96DRAFT_917583 [Gymnopus androsaceus JB14]